ncbi:(p)ppGpp synthetase [Achromobacter sp. Bel]|uniref:GTP pyrophosphokinase n=1 Tax=Achromobacter sp. Bel TaxID=2727415 RepID=UPI00145E8574|nr:(p)ppGpp synthetase [Achromobacter sp. Bel]NMK45201.1 (p)ppGpp synthetase [Achromobacter sp. Bel]
MPTLDFESEKAQFRDFHNSNRDLLEDAKKSFIALTNSLLIHAGAIAVSKIEGRVKDREECIKKFNLKYRTDLESNSTPYTIRDHITDLIGLRVVCLYEDDVEKVEKCLSEHFEIIDKTDKSAQIENTEGSFGYKGLHLDVRLNENRKAMPEYAKYSEFRFEIQVRTIIQDSWSVLDHKIKYKKSIPIGLKRRINTLAALFELADREFREIRKSTVEEIEKEEISDELLKQETDEIQINPSEGKPQHSKLNAFSFLKIAQHFFKDFEFEPHKVDGFTQEIVRLKSGISRGKFNFYMKENIAKAKRYQEAFESSNQNDRLNPYTIIRHCLFLGDRQSFESILTISARESFEDWLAKNDQ